MHRQREQPRTSSHERRQIGIGAAMHTGDGDRFDDGERAGQQVDGDDRARAGSRGRMTAPNSGSSSTTICSLFGNASRHASRRCCTCAHARRAPRRRTRCAPGTPARCSARPSVIGPTNCHLSGPLKSLRSVEEAAEATEGVVIEIGAHRRERIDAAQRRSAIEPYWPTVTPLSSRRAPARSCSRPVTAWAAWGW